MGGNGLLLVCLESFYTSQMIGGISMSQVFEENELVGIKLANRIIRSATGDVMADEQGHPSKEHANLYLQLAKGGVGAIVTSCLNVDPKGIISKTTPIG